MAMGDHSTASVGCVIGLDLGDRMARYCTVDEAGQTVGEGEVAMTVVAMRKTFATQEPSRVALEVGTHSPWVSRILEECGDEVVVANARQLPLIFRSTKKNDRLDAERLARLARVDAKLLSPVKHRGVEAQADLGVLRTRDGLVRARVDLVSHVRGTVKSFGARVRGASTHCFHRKALGDIPERLRPALYPVLEVLAELTKRIDRLEGEIERLCNEKYPETMLLRQVHGVGPVTALAFVLVLEDPRRFRDSRAVGSYVGLRPRQQDSGEQTPQLRITKAGDELLRRLLVGAAQHILGPFGVDSDLRRWGLKLSARGGRNAKKRAVVAVARKLTVLLHKLWRSGEVYEPLRNSQEQTPTAAQQTA